MEQKRALAVAHNWETGETLTQEFTGDGCADSAFGWVHEDSFIWRDFPASEGWSHHAWCNAPAREERGARLSKELLEGGSMSEYVPR